MDKLILQKSAAIIALNEHRIRELWAKIDHYNTYGTMQQETKVLALNVDDMSRADLITACLTLPAWISKANKKLKSLEDGPEKLKLEADIRIKKMELAAIKSLRNGG